MLDIFTIVAPVFLVVGAGYVAVWQGLFSDQAVDGLMVFSQKFAIPCLLFAAMAQLDLSTAFDPKVLFAYFASAIGCFCIGIAVARHIFSRPWPDSVAIGFAAMFANTVLLGLPVMERAYGVDALEANFTIVALNAATCYLIGISTMEFIQAKTRGRALVFTVANAMFHNSIMIGIALGLLVNVSGLPIPLIFADALDLMIRAALPAALFGMGGVLFRYKPEGDLRTILFLCGLSLMVQPAMAFGLAHLGGLETAKLRSVVVTAAMAPGINAYLFADMYGVARRVIASSVLIGTTLTVITASVWLLVLP
ncbi:AEC family transporter [Cognatishimia sp. D5M38]|uniref:AEC family transporter n=1 Tax=Cognatishimia coralii TaxID=3083254 RepID=A0ABU8QB21_9RHOB